MSERFDQEKNYVIFASSTNNMYSLQQQSSIILPDFSERDIAVLKKYYEFNERYREVASEELIARIKDHPLWGPIIGQMTPGQMKAQSDRSREIQRAAIYEGKWKEYIDDLMVQGRMYARMNVHYNEWYELVSLAKVILLPYIKRDYAHSLEEAVDIIDGMSKFVDYAMYGIAEAYFSEKNEIIRSGEERFRVIFENSEDVICQVDRNGLILEINQVTPGQTKQDLIGKNAFSFQGEKNKVIMQDAFRQVLENKTSTYYETDLDTNHGKRYFSSTMGPILNKAGEVESAVIIARDITMQKKAEIELTKLNLNLEQKVSERTDELNSINKELESFTYSVSHDLRAPLRAINGFAEILKEESSEALNEEAKDALSEIINNVSKMGQLIDNLLEFSRLGKKQFSKAEVDMNELFNTVIEDLKKASDKPFSFEIDHLPKANGDRGMLKQVVINLVSNAIKYSSKKENPHIRVSSEINNGHTTYAVKDNGAGFNMRYYDKLFGVFQRLHGASEFEGTGVGLAIVQRIILRHAGKVWAEGKENDGATFYFSLPNHPNQ